MAGNVRSGITPVVAIVLLLMMTVAAAGAAYTWFSQMQSQVQERATQTLQTDMEVKDLRCDSSTDKIEVAIKNSGSTEIELTNTDLFVRDSTGHLNITMTSLDLSTDSGNALCSGGSAGCSFKSPGKFDTATFDVSTNHNIVQGAF
ncbi:MAG: archaellin/type IV pilin N-terminal domain-containing protein, partial [Candidatus Nanohaloarchaea archaeon]